MAAETMSRGPDRSQRPKGSQRLRADLTGDLADLAIPLARWAACIMAVLGTLHSLGLADLR